MKKEFFGILKTGEAVHKYTVRSNALELSVIDFGATVQTLKYMGRDIVLGFDRLEDYENDFLCQGATIGRVADRIEGAIITIDGKDFPLTKNNGEHCLHGGNCFNKRLWKILSLEENNITLFYSSPDGEEGFPHQLDVYVSFTLCGSNFVIEYRAEPFGKTPISLTNHSYFNLDGTDSLILNHKAKLYAKSYAEINERLITTGKRLSVLRTIFDFTELKRIGTNIENGFRGYDNYYFISSDETKDFLGKSLKLAAEICGCDTMLKLYTNQKGFLFYTGNYLKGPDFKDGIKERNFAGLCLETGGEPNAAKRGENFYEKGEIYTHITAFSFEKTL